MVETINPALIKWSWSNLIFDCILLVKELSTFVSKSIKWHIYYIVSMNYLVQWLFLQLQRIKHVAIAFLTLKKAELNNQWHQVYETLDQNVCLGAFISTNILCINEKNSLVAVRLVPYSDFPLKWHFVIHCCWDGINTFLPSLKIYDFTAILS